VEEQDSLERKDSRGQGFKGSSEDIERQASDPRILESFNPAVEPSNPAVAYSFVTRTYVSELNIIGWVANGGEYPDEEVGTGWFPGEKVRLFPNDRRIGFDYPLHERIEPSLRKAGIEIKKCDIPVHHYGNFVNKEKEKSKAEMYYELGKRKIAEHGEQNFMAFYELAIQGAALGKHEETLEYLKKVIALKPDFPKAYQSIGNTYYNLGKYGEALSAYRKAMEIDPGPRDTVLMYATCEIYAGNAETSVALLEEFLRNDPSYPQAILVLAEAYFCLGMKEKGLEFTRKLKDMHFNIEDALARFARLLVSAGRCDYTISLLQAAFEPKDMTKEMRDLLTECYRVAEDPSTSSG
jgi:tetratricopeptide (TPR) repeat protein